MNYKTLKIDCDHDYQIRRHGEETYPEECCGFLFGVNSGDERIVHEVSAISNERESDREHRFLITPEQYQKAEAHASANGFELIGFYHSHPDHPAFPSRFDRDHALPETSYVIVAIDKGRSRVVRSWQLDPDREGYEEETIILNPRV